MRQNISLVTLGVHDLDTSRRFYERLGWVPGSEAEDVAFFQCGGSVLALWGRDRLAADSCVADDGGWGGVTLAHNVASAAEVDALIEEARAAGAEIGREPAATEWGGYSAIFIDPSGHPWEVAHNPFWELTEAGDVRLPGA